MKLSRVMNYSILVLSLINAGARAAQGEWADAWTHFALGIAFLYIELLERRLAGNAPR